MAAKAPIIIKKYGNRRLYDTGESRYITLEELATKVQGGVDVRVVTAKTGEDLTQATLTQIIIEGRGVAQLLPVPLLNQLIRLGDDSLAEFFGRYVTGALELYLQAKRGADRVAPFNPFASLPFQASNALARMWMSPFGGGDRSDPPQAPAGTPEPEPAGTPEPEPEPAGTPEPETEIAAMRRELDELKRSLRSGDAPAETKSRKGPSR